MNKEDIKGIIFDLDGVLFDSEYYQWQAWVIPLKEYGIELTKEMYLKYVGKRSLDQVDQELIEDFNLNIPFGTLWEEKRKLIEKWFSEDALPLIPYAKEAVEYFINNHKFKVALCSAGALDEIMIKLEKNDFTKYFSIIVSGDGILKSKPAPDIYLSAINKLGLKPEECLAFEDTQYGVESAKSAGAYCFAIPTEYSEKQDLSKADRILSSLKEAVDFFEN